MFEIVDTELLDVLWALFENCHLQGRQQGHHSALEIVLDHLSLLLMGIVAVLSLC
jgi:hypothetical protein